MITYATIGTAFLVTFTGFIVHVLWWRLRRPKDDVRALLICFVVIPLVLVVGALFTQSHADIDAEAAGRAVLIGILALLLGSGYILYYPGAQAGSPSMLILLELQRAGAHGLTREDLLARFDEGVLSDATIASLVHERFATRTGTKLFLARRGHVMLRPCQMWRKILGLPDGGG